MGTVRRTLKKAKTKPASTPLVKFLKRGLLVGGAAGFIGIAASVGFMIKKIQDVAPLVDHIGDRIKEYNSKPSKIYSTNGKLLYEISPVYREPVVLSTLPNHVKYAILAAEDKRFYEHSGFDPFSIKRVFSGAGGGSTITMQLAKKLFSASEHTLDRKVQDVSIAINLEKRYTKDQILELYINQIYYGEQAYGLNAAAEIYFGKKAEDLDIAEAAMIARCIRLPSSQNPVKNYQKANENKIVVLDTMREEKWITDDEYEKAKQEKPKVKGFSKQKFSHVYAAPYFVAAVKRDLEKMGYNISQGGYTITTTLDTDIEDAAEKSIQKHVVEDSEANVGAFLAMDSEGRVLADVGGRDHSKNQYSFTTQSPLQPGSSFKSFVYAEALKEGIISEGSEISNEKLIIPQGRGIPSYEPKNHGGYGGTVTLDRAFALSINVPAVRTFVQLGVGKAADQIKEDFGFDSEIKHFPAAALGASEVKGIEMLEAYSVFMLDGKRVHPYRIKEVDDPSGNIVYQGRMEFVNTRIGPEVTQTMDKLMRDVVEWGTGTRAAECPDAHGKTGTTNEGKSVWFCGYAKGVVGIAWAGKQHYDKKRKQFLLSAMPDSYGGDVAAPVWADAMNAAISKYGSDVKPDFSKHPESSEMRHKKSEDTPDSNNEPQPEDDNNVAPDVNTPVSPGTTDPDQLRTGDGTANPPAKDPASSPGNGDTPPPKPDTIPKPKDKPKTTTRTTTEESDYVEVEVCADSGLLATRYCPETINKKFPKNRRPKRHCTVHKAPDEGGG